MQIYFVTGKGGVGKSSVATALALAKANSGLRTFLVELCDPSFLTQFLGTQAFEGTPIALRENLHLVKWTGAACLKEYAKHLLKMEGLVSLFFENPVSQALINVAPALKELAILGKITSGPPRNVGPKLDCDCLVIDAFSSGHFMALLRAPEGMKEAIRFGPMFEQSRDILQVLSNPDICQTWIVSQPEALPVTEALELAVQVEKQTGQKPVQILNRCLTIPATMSDVPVLKKFSAAVGEIEIRQQQMRERLLAHSETVIELPWILELSTWPLVESLSKVLQNRGEA